MKKRKPEPESTAEEPQGNPNIQVEITDMSEVHCFRLTLNPKSAPGEKIEIMFHARSLVDLIHKCSLALSDWQAETTAYLLRKMGAPPPAQSHPDSHGQEVLPPAGRQK